MSKVPKNIQEALKARQNEAPTPPPQTVEAITEVALQRASLESRLGADEQYPENGPPSGEKKRVGPPPEPEPLFPQTNSFPLAPTLAGVTPEERYKNEVLTEPLNQEAREKIEKLTETTIPVSNTDLQPAIPSSIPESVETKDEPIVDFKQVMAVDVARDEPTEELNLRRIREYINDSTYSVNWVALHLQAIGRMQAVLPGYNLWNAPGINVPQVVYDTVKSPGYIDTIWPILKIVMGNSIDNMMWVAAVTTTIALFDIIRLLPYSQMEPPQEG